MQYPLEEMETIINYWKPGSVRLTMQEWKVIGTKYLMYQHRKSCHTQSPMHKSYMDIVETKILDKRVMENKTDNLLSPL